MMMSPTIILGLLLAIHFPAQAVAFDGPAAPTGDEIKANNLSVGREIDFFKLRDPFVLPEAEAIAGVQKTDLEKFPLDAFKLVGVMSGPLHTRAMIVSPDGKSYFVSEKMRIGTANGTVKKINPESIVVLEKVQNLIGTVETVENEIKMISTDISKKDDSEASDKNDKNKNQKDDADLSMRADRKNKKNSFKDDFKDKNGNPSSAGASDKVYGADKFQQMTDKILEDPNVLNKVQQMVGSENLSEPNGAQSEKTE